MYKKCIKSNKKSQFFWRLRVNLRHFFTNWTYLVTEAHGRNTFANAFYHSSPRSLSISRKILTKLLKIRQFFKFCLLWCPISVWKIVFIYFISIPENTVFFVDPFQRSSWRSVSKIWKKTDKIFENWKSLGFLSIFLSIWNFSFSILQISFHRNYWTTNLFLVDPLILHYNFTSLQTLWSLQKQQWNLLKSQLDNIFLPCWPFSAFQSTKSVKYLGKKCIKALKLENFEVFVIFGVNLIQFFSKAMQLSLHERLLDNQSFPCRPFNTSQFTKSVKTLAKYEWKLWKFWTFWCRFETFSVKKNCNKLIEKSTGQHIPSLLTLWSVPINKGRRKFGEKLHKSFEIWKISRFLSFSVIDTFFSEQCNYLVIKDYWTTNFFLVDALDHSNPIHDGCRILNKKCIKTLKIENFFAFFSIIFGVNLGHFHLENWNKPFMKAYWTTNSLLVDPFQRSNPQRQWKNLEKIPKSLRFLSFSVSIGDIFFQKTATISSNKPNGQRISAMLNIFSIVIHEDCGNYDKNCIKTLKISGKFLFLVFFGSFSYEKTAVISS